MVTILTLQTIPDNQIVARTAFQGGHHMPLVTCVQQRLTLPECMKSRLFVGSCIKMLAAASAAKHQFRALDITVQTYIQGYVTGIDMQ